MQGAPPALPPSAPGAPRPWWETRWFVAAMVLVALVPLLYPPVPPLVDLPGHMARYRVQLDIAHSPELQQFYEFHWYLIGNLGIDLLIIPMSKLFGLELGTKLIVMAIPALTVAGFLWVAREVHNRIPPTALFALPFAYGHPFLFGFTNFALSMALAFLAFGLWLRLGRQERTRLRAWLFVPISFILFITHTFGWGTLGLLAFSAESVRLHDKGTSWWKAAIHAALHAAVMAGPVALMLLWRSSVSQGMTADWFNWDAKLMWLMMALRDRWQVFDYVSVIVPVAMLAEALRNKRLAYSRNLAFSALVLIAGFVILPRIIFGSAYADMRLAPYMFAVALLAIRFRRETALPLAQILAVLGLAFYLVRIGSTTLSLGMSAQDQGEKLEALDHVPRGARMVTLVGQICGHLWALPRKSHWGALATVRRNAFSNDQWAIEGANLLSVRFDEAGPFKSDPSQIVRAQPCAGSAFWTPEKAMAALPRDAIDYVWTIDLPRHDPAIFDDLIPLWRGPQSALYATSRQAAEAARRSEVQ